MLRHIAKKFANEAWRKIGIEYPAVVALIDNHDVYIIGHIESAILKAAQHSVQLTAVSVTASSSSTNYVVANFDGN